MEDEELQAIRRARMQQLRQQGGGAGGGGAGPSMMSAMGGAGASRGPPGQGGEDDDGEDASNRAAQMEEQKRQMLSTILDGDARERLSRISLVKPQKAQGITNLLIQMAQSGQIRSRINEEQLIGLLEQVERAQGAGGDSGAGKIVYNRKKMSLDDDDDDFDL